MSKNNRFLIVLALLVCAAMIWFWPGSNGETRREQPSTLAGNAQASNLETNPSSEKPGNQLLPGSTRDQARRQDHRNGFDTSSNLTGQVTDPAYQAIAGATIQVEPYTQDKPSTIHSDADGFFDWPLSPVPPVDIVVSAPGFFSRALKFPTGEDQETIVLEYGGQLDVRVVDEEGHPIQNVLIKSTGASDQRTDAQGLASLKGVIVPTKLSLSAPDFNDLLFTVPPETDFQEITLLRNGALIGQVLDQATNLPVLEFQIKPRGLYANSPNDTFDTKDGRFQILGLPRDQKEFVVFAKGYMTKAVTIGKCLPLAKTKPIEIRLSDKGFTLSGTVMEASGDPIAKASVTAFIGFEGNTWMGNFTYPQRQDGKWQLVQPWIDTLETLTDANGHFDIGPFPEKTTLGLITIAEGFAPTQTPNPESLIQDQRKNIKIVLGPYGVLEGEAGQSDSPHPRGITLSSTFKRAETISLAPGQTSFRIEKLVPGRYAVHFSAAPGTLLKRGDPSPIVPDRKEVQIQPGSTETIQIGFSDRLRMGGRIFLDGQPMGDTQIMIQQKSLPQRHFFTNSDGNGDFEIYPLAPGTYEIMANGGIGDMVFGTRNREKVELEADRTDLAIYFYSMGSVYGRVVTEPAGASLTMEITYKSGDKEFSTNRKWAAVQEGGHFQFDNVPGGEFNLTLKEVGTPPALLLLHQVMPDDGSDLDLGDLGGESGDLLITLTGDENSRYLTHSFYNKPFGDPNATGQLLVQMSLDESPKQLHGLKSGKFIIQPQPITGFRITPHEKAITIQKNTQAVAHFSVKGETSLRVFADIGDERLEFRSVRLVEHATGKTWPVPFRTQAPSTSNQGNAAIDMYYQSNEVALTGIPPGIWQLTLTDQFGRLAMRQFTLLPGKPIYQGITAEAFEAPRKDL